MTRILRIGAFALVALALSACASTMPRRPIVPVALSDAATIPHDATLRHWGDDPDFVLSHTKVKPGPDDRVDFLTLSGGGINGAFGAGYLVGWSQARTRPEFEVVTGISVGAIMAPLAFLGSHYDDRLQLVFSTLTETRPKSGVLAAIFGAPSILSNEPLVDAIDLVVDAAVLSEIAREHREGRRLYVGTTNLDAQRPVVWDIGAIANSALPDRLELVHDILLASAAVPGIFPPVLLDVNAQGHDFDEMHVDGGVTQQLVLMPGGYGRVGRNQSSRLYVIFNGVLDPTKTTVQVSSMELVGRAVPTLLKYLGRANLNELVRTAKASGIDYRISAMPVDFPESESLFGSAAWLESLFDYGRQSGLAGVWQEQK